MILNTTQVRCRLPLQHPTFLSLGGLPVSTFAGEGDLVCQRRSLAEVISLLSQDFRSESRKCHRRPSRSSRDRGTAKALHPQTIPDWSLQTCDLLPSMSCSLVGWFPHQHLDALRHSRILPLHAETLFSSGGIGAHCTRFHHRPPARCGRLTRGSAISHTTNTRAPAHG